MKWIILLAVVLLAMALPAQAGPDDVEMKFAWDASDPIEEVVEYRMYLRTPTGTYGTFFSTPTTTATVTVDKNTTYHAVVTAVNRYGLESAYSTEVVFKARPNPPRNFRRLP